MKLWGDGYVQLIRLKSPCYECLRVGTSSDKGNVLMMNDIAQQIKATMCSLDLTEILIHAVGL